MSTKSPSQQPSHPTDDYFKLRKPLTIQETDAAPIKDIYHALRAAQLDLQQFSIRQRAAEVDKIIDHIKSSKELICNRIVKDTGKSRTDALVSEVLGVLDNLHWNKAHAHKILKAYKVSTPISLLGKKSYIQHEPYGTVLVIAPWNYPFHIAMTFITGAFLAGNSIIFKPSEHTPLTGLIEEICAVSPLLKQNLKVIYGSGVTAERLIDEKPDKIFFTGSTRTGKAILKKAAQHIIPVDLELGGKDAMVVFPDVDIQRTVAGALWGGLTNAGQSCTSVELLCVHEDIFEQFSKQLTTQIQQLVINTGDQGDADIGAMTTDFQLDIVKQQLDDAIEKGATIITGGNTFNEKGRFFPPTLITNISPEMKLYKEETFGPVIALLPFSNEKQLVTQLNQLPYGLSASIWSRDLSRAKRMASALQVGAVSINNVMLTEGNPALPFGGVKQSGFGRAKGKEGLLAFTRSKSILVDKQSNKIEPNWYPYTLKKYQLFQQLIDTLFTSSWSKLIRLAKIGMALESEAKKSRHNINH
ncbi:aldehyde dehydrogenase family protein [Endozoicomonas sp. SM1973]|uniref:Aldehyde dehydrogenase n=1 Tax=Spartinivicinus marinus TaxID=2994442 RepID=A0A853IFC1_9GAMM|nr:aldehyde dehydrogenase family protein [Spartinivicinus marinus]MCX4028128.1 aldehyde dehydrogenase family protein [Spartinivicinus marinus]NYZ66196.1 aldehyde dehydrogenase family protein [Spartinivicinus marinus]